MTTPSYRTFGNLGSRANTVTNDVSLLVGRMNQAIDLLDAWCLEHPDDRHLVIASKNLIARCDELDQPREHT